MFITLISYVLTFAIGMFFGLFLTYAIYKILASNDKYLYEKPISIENKNQTVENITIQ